MEEEQAFTFAVPSVKSAKRAPLGFSWGSGNELTVFSTPKRKPFRKGEKEGPKTKEKVHKKENLFVSIHWGYSDHETRRMVAESEGVFQTLWRDVNMEGRSKLSTLEKRFLLLNCSKNYRGLIRAYHFFYLQKTISFRKEMFSERVLSNEELEEKETARAFFNHLESIWHLAEIFYIMCTNNTQAVLTPYLLSWLQITLGVDDAIDIYSDSETTFWEKIYGLLLRGMHDKAAEIFEAYCYKHPRMIDQNTFKKIKFVLQKFPKYDSSRPESEFQSKWREYQDLCRKYLDSAEELGLPVVKLFSILAGDLPTLAELCSNWFELLVVNLVFSEPLTRASEIRYMTEDCLAQFNQQESDLHLVEKIYLSVFNMDPETTIKYCTQLGSCWFSAHLLDLLHHADLIPQPIDELEETDAREKAVLEYAHELMTHPSLWQIAAGYLATCPTYGLAILEELLERQCIDSERKAKKMLNLCKKFGFVDVENTILRTVGTNKARAGRYSCSLVWFASAKEGRRMNEVINKVLNRIRTTLIEKGEVEDVGLVLENIPHVFIFSGKIAFLQKCQDIRSSVLVKDFSAAAQHVVEALQNGVAPKLFWIPLLLLAVSFMSENEQCLGSSSINHLLWCLEEISLSHKRDLYFGPLSKKVPTIRLALTRALARGQIYSTLS